MLKEIQAHIIENTMKLLLKFCTDIMCQVKCCKTSFTDEDVNLIITLCETKYQRFLTDIFGGSFSKFSSVHGLCDPASEIN